MASVGDVVSSRYHLLTRLGAGALGEVWAARDETTDREVAVKLLSPGNGNGNGAPKWTIARKSLDSFFREAKASAKIRNPSVVELLDLGESKVAPPGEGWKAHEKKTAFVVMELLEGEKLEDLLEEQRTLPVGTALRLASEVAWALVAAHEKGLIHERIEPANVILHRSGKGEIVPKLVDFGIARLVDDLDILPGTPHEALSPLEYLSPEQIHGDVELDGRADVYSLGALLHRCLVGVPPFDGKDSDALLAQVEGGPKKLEEYEPPLDSKVVQLVADCLHRNRKLRPTMRVLAERLDVLRERFDAQWKTLTQKIKVPPERTIERISSMRPPPRPTTKAIAPPRPGSTPTSDTEEVERISSSSLEEVPESKPPASGETVDERELEEAPVSAKLTDADIEDAPPSVKPVTSVPPPLPKSGPVSHIIREKLGQTKDASGLDVLADLESELLKHVAAQRASETPEPPTISLPRVDDVEEVEAVESAPSPQLGPPALSTAKTLPPQRERDRVEQAKKSGAMVMFALAAAIALVALIAVRREQGAGAQPQPSTVPSPTAVATPAPTPEPSHAPTPIPTVVEIAPIADPSASASAPIPSVVAPTATQAPTVVPLPAPPATTAAAPTAAAPKPTAAAPKPTAAPPATTAAPPASTAAKPKPPVAGKPTGDPYFGVESAGF
ncbi:MAG: protein kinase domain-containing protein [Polyangiales bacterium]